MNQPNTFNAYGEISDLLRPLELMRCSTLNIDEAAKIHAVKRKIGVTAARDELCARLKDVMSAEERSQ